MLNTEKIDLIGDDAGWEDVPFVPSNALTDFWRMMATEAPMPLGMVTAEGTPVVESHIIPYRVGLGFRVKRDDPDYESRVSGGRQSLEVALNTTKEHHAANRLNNCMSTAAQYVGGDGVPLASENHSTLVDGMLLSNLKHAPFGTHGVEDLVQVLAMAVGWLGEPKPDEGPYELLLHPVKMVEARRLVWSDNDQNMLARVFQKIISSPCFVNLELYAVRSANNHPFRYTQGEPLKFQKKQDGEWDRYRMVESYCFFEDGWRGVAVSDGTGVVK